MDGAVSDMDLTTRPKDDAVASQENCKMRSTNSIFSIRSLVNIADGLEQMDGMVK
ncbi:hypothetical protein GWI33_015387, partial [Rhynchophorus ferrugineus]